MNAREGTGARLVRITSADLAPPPAWFSTPDDLARWTGGWLSYPLDPEVWAAHVAASADDAAGHRCYALAPEAAGRPPPAYGELTGIDVDAGRADLSRIVVAPDARGHGLGSALVQGLVEEAGHLGLRRLALRVFDHNTAAIAVYRRLGFTPVRALPGHLEVAGELWDAVELTLGLGGDASASPGKRA